MTEYTGAVRALPGLGEKASYVSISFWILGFALLTALGALIRVPLPYTPVPITMQTFFALMAGVILGKSRGSLSQGAYVLLGALGLPIFSGMGSGFLWLTGPTGGYIAGFILAPAVVATIVGGSTAPFRLIAGFGAGTAVIFLLGIVWLLASTSVSVGAALNLGLYPFIPGAVIKIGLATAVTGALLKGKEKAAKV